MNVTQVVVIYDSHKNELYRSRIPRSSAPSMSEACEILADALDKHLGVSGLITILSKGGRTTRLRFDVVEEV